MVSWAHCRSATDRGTIYILYTRYAQCIVFYTLVCRCLNTDLKLADVKSISPLAMHGNQFVFNH